MRRRTMVIKEGEEEMMMMMESKWNANQVQNILENL